MTSPTSDQLLDAFSDPGNKQEAIRLLSAFPDQSEIKNIKDSDFWYLIHKAAHNGWTDIVELLATTYHCNPNCIDIWGRTSLHWACHNNQLPTVKLSTTQYCLNPLEADSFGVTPLDWSSGETKIFLQQIIGKCVCVYICIVCIFVLY